MYYKSGAKFFNKGLELFHNKIERAQIQAAVGVRNATNVIQNAQSAALASQDKNIHIDANVFRCIRYSLASFVISSNQTVKDFSLFQNNTIIEGIRDTRKEFDETTNYLIDNINKQLQPVSSFMGSTLGTMTGVLRDPLGSLYYLPNTLGNMLDKLNPNLSTKFEATFKKFHFEKLIEMPSNIVGSIYHLAQILDNTLALPIRIISDLYYGALEILEEINNFIEDIFNKIQQFFTNIIDGIFPGLLDFLDALVDFANEVGAIVSIFSGPNNITGVLNQAIFSINSINRILQNPLDLVYANMPSQANQFLYTIRNPEALINQFLPPELSQWMAKISAVTGFGFNGNMGYGFASVLAGFRDGILTGILDGFAAQFGILAPLLTNAKNLPPSFSSLPDKVEVPDINNGVLVNVAGAKITGDNQSTVKVQKEP